MDADTEIRTSAEMSIWQCQDQGGSQMHPRSWGKVLGAKVDRTQMEIADDAADRLLADLARGGRRVISAGKRCRRYES